MEKALPKNIFIPIDVLFSETDKKSWKGKIS